MARGYFTRFHTDSAFVPVEVAGFMVRNSSSVIEVTTRLPSVPLNFANELPSKRTVIVLLAPSWTCSRFVDRGGAHNPMRIGK